MLVLGGVVPLLLVPVLAVFLPESGRLLALRGAGSGKIAATLGRVTGHRFSGSETFVSTEPPLQARKPIGPLFSRGYVVTTVSLWVTYFVGLLVIYLLTGWLPTIMRDAGRSIATAANVTALFQIGGTVGAVIAGWAMDKARHSREEILRATDIFLEHGVFIETGPHKHAVQQTFFPYVYELGGNWVEVANAGARLVLAPDWKPITWTEAERRKGLAWG